jgi:membrane-bound lytic murein transglycosylase B
MSFFEPECAVPWWAIAAISRVEGRHGTYGGSVLDQLGWATPDIIGIQLNGQRNTRVIGDTDGGMLDHDPAYDRAVGPMQFIPSTGRRVAADGNFDQQANPHNLYDATLAAAAYLCRASSGLASEEGLRRAYFSYNHSLAYVENVLRWARSYEQLGLLEPGPSPPTPG